MHAVDNFSDSKIIEKLLAPAGSKIEIFQAGN